MSTELETRLRRYGETFDSAVDEGATTRQSSVLSGEQRSRRRVWVGVAVASLAVVSALGVYGLFGRSSDSQKSLRVQAGAPVTPGTASPSDCVSGGATQITVPDVVGKRLGPAIREVQGAGLNVIGFGTVKTDPVDPESRVWAQKPEGDAKVPLGACVGFRTANFVSSSVAIVARASLTFDREEYTVPAGKVTVHFTGASGLTLGFADPRFRKCRLTTDRDGPHACRVTLTPGRYRIYDIVPGHRAAGLEATIVVPEPGR